MSKLNATKANQLLEANNILLKAIATNLGINVEEVLCPTTKKYSPTYDDEDIKPEEEGEDEELLNWYKNTKEVKEITPEVSVQKENERVEMVTPEIMAAWAEKEREIEEEEKEITPEVSVEEPIVIEEVKEEIKAEQPIVKKQHKAICKVKEEEKKKSTSFKKECAERVKNMIPGKKKLC